MVNNDGGVLLDQYVKPAEKVTDYRTFVSGIEPAHLKEGATTLSEAQQQVAKVLTGRILVGHAVHHDLQVFLSPDCKVQKPLELPHAVYRPGSSFARQLIGLQLLISCSLKV